MAKFNILGEADDSVNISYALAYLPTVNKKTYEYADEIIFPYTTEDQTFGIDIKDKDVIILSDTSDELHLSHNLEYFKNELGALIIKCLSAKSITIKFNNSYWYSDEAEDIIDYLTTDSDVYFCFADPATSWSQLDYYVKLGVDQVYIDGELGFSLPTVDKICSKNDITVRCYPAVATPFNSREHNDWYPDAVARSFWIRPEDLEDYSYFIDVFEFYDYDGVRLTAVFDAYRKRKFTGYINDLIDGMESLPPINNSLLLPESTSLRKSCNQGCMKGRGCNQCSRLLETATQRKKLIAMAVEDIKDTREELQYLEDSGQMESEEFIETLHRYRTKVNILRTNRLTKDIFENITNNSGPAMADVTRMLAMDELDKLMDELEIGDEEQEDDVE